MLALSFPQRLSLFLCFCLSLMCDYSHTCSDQQKLTVVAALSATGDMYFPSLHIRYADMGANVPQQQD